jgi:hypothetical protein
VGTDAKKDEFIKIRVTSEQKELFKRVAYELNISMTELLVVGTEELARRKEESIKSRNMINDRASRMEQNIQMLRDRMESRRNKKRP